VGQGRPSTFNLPSDDFTFGMPEKRTGEGTKEGMRNRSAPYTLANNVVVSDPQPGRNYEVTLLTQLLTVTVWTSSLYLRSVE